MHEVRRMAALCAGVAALACVPPAAAPAQTPVPDTRTGAVCALPTSTPEAEGIDGRRVAQLIDSARATSSDAIVVLRNGRVIGEWYSDSGRVPIQTMSVTKSIVGLAIGRLLHDRQLDSLDQPVWTLYPEWRQGRKRQITIRHLLNHTSGLQDLPGDGPEIEPAPDAIQLALAAELMANPGEYWFYSNKGTNLLGGIVERASGRKLDAYVRETLLRPMCITDGAWAFRDRSGNPYAMAGLALHARDLAKIGQMMLDSGTWHGTTVVPREWVAASITPSQPHDPRYGMLWWIENEWFASAIDSALVRRWTDAGIPRELTDLLAGLTGRRFTGGEWRAALDSVLGVPAGSGQGMQRLAEATRQRAVPMRRIITGPARGYSANGSLGQWLVVYPEERLVIVRQIRRKAGHTHRHTFADLPQVAHALLVAE